MHGAISIRGESRNVGARKTKAGVARKGSCSIGHPLVDSPLQFFETTFQVREMFRGHLHAPIAGEPGISVERLIVFPHIGVLISQYAIALKMSAALPVQLPKHHLSEMHSSVEDDGRSPVWIFVHMNCIEKRLIMLRLNSMFVFRRHKRVAFQMTIRI